MNQSCNLIDVIIAWCMWNHSWLCILSSLSFLFSRAWTCSSNLNFTENQVSQLQENWLNFKKGLRIKCVAYNNEIQRNGSWCVKRKVSFLFWTTQIWYIVFHHESKSFPSGNYLTSFYNIRSKDLVVLFGMSESS